MVLSDTEKVHERLLQSGVPEQQARAHGDIARMMSEAGADKLATTDDLQLLRKDLEGQMQTLRKDLGRQVWRAAMTATGLVLAGLAIAATVVASAL